MKVYIAAPFFNDEQLERVKKVERILEAEKIDYFSPRSFGVIKDMTQEEKDRRMKDVYEKNIEELNSCDVIVVFVDVPDTGTIFELGYSACNKVWCDMHSDRGMEVSKIITFSENKKPVNLMLRYCIDSHVTNFVDLHFLLMEIKRGGEVPNNYKIFPEVNE